MSDITSAFAPCTVLMLIFITSFVAEGRELPFLSKDILWQTCCGHLTDVSEVPREVGGRWHYCCCRKKKKKCRWWKLQLCKQHFCWKQKQTPNEKVVYHGEQAYRVKPEESACSAPEEIITEPGQGLLPPSRTGPWAFLPFSSCLSFLGEIPRHLWCQPSWDNVLPSGFVVAQRGRQTSCLRQSLERKA